MHVHVTTYHENDNANDNTVKGGVGCLLEREKHLLLLSPFLSPKLKGGGHGSTLVEPPLKVIEKSEEAESTKYQ